MLCAAWNSENFLIRCRKLTLSILLACLCCFFFAAVFLLRWSKEVSLNGPCCFTRMMEASLEMMVISVMLASGANSHLMAKPLFEKGRIEKLELHHIPTVPESETAENASLLLEESLRTENAVRFIAESNNWHHGNPWLGRRVREALTVLIYKMSLSTKFVGPSSGKSKSINVVAERIGDFCWYIHGVCLLPIQVFLALVILYRNLGAASIAAVFATILVMVSNTPLSNRQERLHSKIMEAKDSRIKANCRDSKKHENKSLVRSNSRVPRREDQWKFITGCAPKESDVAIEIEAEEYAWDKAYVPQRSWVQTGTIRENYYSGRRWLKLSMNMFLRHVS
ncbi:hypothetical protein F3Y22_tig00110831pilonHSYRG00083 [Hibiscus syriacus]|uniref:ABC transmembrane type-1 domain-containing protein n=1 Tax=Hibiscus syriacus TaxID=106335 RepID=A0A6A2ZMQ3_HIBSY|nr:hypothetical protein F3Y22_tig00110831pilonHSYRG00083 [Hibiscus syriacus]